MKQQKDIVIIGAGAAGLMAAGSVCGNGKSIAVLERNEKVGKKLYITGKGRCNVTNACSATDCAAHVVTNPKFLYSALNNWTSLDTVALLEKCGCKTKVERGNRVFPVSDKASDVIKALQTRAVANGAEFYLNETVQRVCKTQEGFTVTTDKAEYACAQLLLTTGGKSYPATGSTGDGYAFARALGHTVTPLRPSLVPLLTEEDVSALAGVSLKNVQVSLSCGSKTVSRFGEMLFTHTGLSGPAVLWLSAQYAGGSAACEIDLKPALAPEQLDKRILRELTENGGKTLRNMLCRLLPKALIAPVLLQSGIDGEQKGHSLTKEQRLSLGKTVKSLHFTVNGTEGFASAVITRGGVDVKEIDPKTMQSKLVPGLFFAGEIIDVDALTGGFNLQVAFSTANAAARAMGKGEER